LKLRVTVALSVALFEILNVQYINWVKWVKETFKIMHLPFRNGTRLLVRLDFLERWSKFAGYPPDATSNSKGISAREPKSFE